MGPSGTRFTMNELLFYKNRTKIVSMSGSLERIWELQTRRRNHWRSEDIVDEGAEDAVTYTILKFAREERANVAM